jgi:hypothetical protein
MDMVETIVLSAKEEWKKESETCNLQESIPLREKA